MNLLFVSQGVFSVNVIFNDLRDETWSSLLSVQSDRENLSWNALYFVFLHFTLAAYYHHPYGHHWSWPRCSWLSVHNQILPFPRPLQKVKTGWAPPDLYIPTSCTMREENVETEHVNKFKLNLTCSNWSFQTLKPHTLYPFVCRGSESLMWSEADTCQQSPPCLPLAALTMSSLKAALAEGEWKAFFSSSFYQSPSAWFLPWSTHSWTFNSFQLPYVGASAASDSESRAIVTTTELVLSFSLEALALIMQSN